MSGFLGSGELYGDRLTDDGSSTGLLHLGNATKFAITEGSDIKERLSTGIGTYGQVLDTASIKKPSKVAITLDDINKDNLAMAMLGDVTALNQGAGSLAGEPINAKEGKFVRLSKGNLTSGTVVVKDQTDTTTYVDGTDYEVHYRIGMIKVLTGGTIADGAEIHVSADHAAISGFMVSGGVRPTVKMKLLLDGRNLAGNHVLVDVDEAVLTPSGEVDFLSNNWTSITMGGSLRTLPGKTVPYTVEMRD